VAPGAEVTVEVWDEPVTQAESSGPDKAGKTDKAKGGKGKAAKDQGGKGKKGKG
jgi:hypothetical protein